MEALFLCMIVFGLIVCFGGIYLKKFCSALTGFLNGALLTMIFITLAFGAFRLMRDESLVYVLIFAIIGAIVSAVHEKVCAFINGFIPSFVVVAVLILLTQSSSSSKGMDGTAIIVLSLVIASIIGGISAYIYDYAFMLETAFTGAFIASLGVAGLYDKAYDLSDVVLLFIREKYIGGILLGTITLGIIGFIVQLHRFKKNKEIIPDKEVSNSIISSWKCECGNYNPNEELFCNQCGKKRTEQAQTASSEREWKCSCGTYNTVLNKYCSECGKEKLNSISNKVETSSPIVVSNANQWICSCGAKQPLENVYCSECGKKRDETL